MRTNNLTRSLYNRNIVSFSVDARDMANAMDTIKENFWKHLDDIAETGDNKICDDDWDGGDEEITVKITDTLNDITYNVTYGFGTICEGDGFVTTDYEGCDDYYDRVYNTDVELDEFYIMTTNEAGDEGYDIMDVTIDGDKASMEYFNNKPVEERIKLFKSMTVSLRIKNKYTDYNLSDYVFENAKEMY
jgi:hypothetical protein